MAEIIWTKPADKDLEEIADYIAIDKVSAAVKLIDKILEKVGRLADFLESGRILPEFENSKYREIIVKPCRIIYFQKEKKIYIVHVIRSERQLRKYMLEDVIHEKPSKYRT